MVKSESCEQNKKRGLIGGPPQIACHRCPLAISKLNASSDAPWSTASRRRNSVAPLLIIAGAGSGKTNTLAHRVAHLIVNGADPRRILLMTFSRRAAAEMAPARRAHRAQGPGRTRGVMTDALTWAGTFHGIGARLLRDYAEQIGLDPAFTIHDREDSADLMNLVRHELGFSKTESRFPTKGTCLAIYSRASTPRRRSRGARRALSRGAPAGKRELQRAVRGLRGGQADARTCSITTICCSTGRR